MVRDIRAIGKADVSYVVAKEKGRFPVGAQDVYALLTSSEVPTTTKDAFLLEKGEWVDSSEKGILYRVKIGNKPTYWLKVFNSTKTNRGDRLPYFLSIDEECKPMLSHGYGPPQKLTVQNAIASTFGLTGKEYQPVIET